MLAGDGVPGRGGGDLARDSLTDLLALLCGGGTAVFDDRHAGPRRAAFVPIHIGRVRDRDQALRGRAWFKALVTIIVLAIPLMTIQMTALQQLDGGLPGRWTLLAVLLLYGATALVGLRQRQRGAFQRVDRPLLAAVTVHFVTFFLIVSLFDPVAHHNTSVHQTYGPCGVKTTDVMGLERDLYICPDAYLGDFHFDCGVPLPEDGAHWYTVCGRPHQNRPLWMGVVGAIGLTGLLLFGHALGPWLRRREGDVACIDPDPGAL